MNDRLFFSLLGLAAAAMIALALVWPQGLGAPSPAPFGHPLAAEPVKKKAAAPPSILTGLPTAAVQQSLPAASDAEPAR